MKTRFFTFISLIFFFTTNAQDRTIDGVNYTIFNSNSVHVSSNSCYDGNFVMPSAVSISGQNYEVTEINANAFENCTTLTSITFPSTLFTISAGAFSNCTALESVTVPSTVSSLGKGVFNGCSAMLSANIQNNQTLIGSSLFKNCISLASVTLPNSITTIEDRAFENCSSLQSITIPSSVQRIESFVFSSSGLTMINIPNSVTSIGSNVFSNSKLTSIDIPSSIDEIPSGLFAGCKELETVNIPNSITEINSSAFAGCSKLNNITLPNSLQIIKNSAFTSSGLTTITIPESVNEIEYFAFRDCWNLTSVIMGNSVNSIGAAAFERCYKLTDITLSEQLSSLSGSLFRQCFGLESIVIPQSVTQFSDKVFEKCSKLTAVNIPNGVTNIGKNTFDGCLKLEKIEIPSSVTSIDTFAFANTILNEVKVNWQTPLTITPDVFDKVNLSLATLKVPQNTDQLYSITAVWEDFGTLSSDTNVPEGYTAIPDTNFEQHLINENIDTESILDGKVLNTDIETIQTLNIDSKNISSLVGIEGFLGLKELNARNNSITSVNFSNNEELETLFLSNNQISNIDVSKNLKLKSLDVGENLLKLLDIHLLTNLEGLFIYKNQLTEINLFSNKNLIQLTANDNQIKTADLRENIELFNLNLENNSLEDLIIKNGNNTNISVFNITNNPNLTCVEVDDVSYSQTNWTNVDDSNIFSTDCAPSNDDCVNAIPLIFNQVTPGDVISGNISNNMSSCVVGNIVADVWYTISVPSSGEFSIQGNAIGGALKFALYDDCTATNEIACGSTISLQNLNPTDTYYLKVWLEGSAKSLSSEAGTFTLTASESSVLSVDENTISENTFTLFPNPVNNVLNISAKNMVDHIEIYTLSGKKIISKRMEKESESIDVSNLAKGIYILKSFSNNIITQRKFIKK